MRRIATFIVLMTSIVIAPALAQTSETIAQAENKHGLLKFCQGRGYVDPSAVGAQKRVIDNMGVGGADMDGSNAEDLGEKGFMITRNGNTTTLDRVATSQNISVEAECVGLAGGRQGMGSAPSGDGSLAGIPGVSGISNQIAPTVSNLLGRITGH